MKPNHTKRIKFISLIITSIIILSIFSACGNSSENNEIKETTAVSLQNLDEAIAYGNCGVDDDNVKWALYDDGELVIRGVGNMADYYSSEAPWYTVKDYVKTVKIEDGVTSIGAYAVYSCNSLTNITIPSSVSSIRSAFSFCHSLTNISVDSNNPDYSNDLYGVLYDKNKTKLIQYPAGNTKTSFSIPNSVSSIGENAFINCRNLTSIKIPNSVSSIGEDAFGYCKNLADITIPNSVTNIGSYAFRYCDSLTNIKLPDNVTEIGEHTFENCDNLASITIPSSVSKIGDYAFSSCHSLTNVFYTGTAQQWSDIFIGSYNSDLLNATIHYNS